MRLYGNGLTTFIGDERDPMLLVSRLRSAGLLSGNVDEREVLAVIQAAFERERAARNVARLNPGEYRAHMVLDFGLKPFLSQQGVDLMSTKE